MEANPPRALVVDDEHALADLVADYLRRDGFDVTTCGRGDEALEHARALDPEVVILDLGLPGLDGVEVCRRIRTFSECYIVMLTARTDEVDTLVGLSVGADDYVTKPFSPRELVARVRAMRRRPRGGPDPDAAEVASVGDLRIDLAAHEITLAGKGVALTATEFAILAALASRPRAVFTRENLLHAVWGDHWVGDAHAVDVHVQHIRAKLGDDARHQRYVRTVRGVGYRIGSGE